MADPPVRRLASVTTDPELAHEWIAAAYTEHTPRIFGSREDFRMRMRMRVRGASTELFGIDQVEHTMSVSADTEPYPVLRINRLLSGRYWMSGPRVRLARGPADITMMDPGRSGRIVWEASRPRW